MFFYVYVLRSAKDGNFHDRQNEVGTVTQEVISTLAELAVMSLTHRHDPSIGERPLFANLVVSPASLVEVG